MRALEVLAEASLRAGELGAAEDAARAAVAAAPFRESAHRLLMEVHEAGGNPAEALRVFEDLRRLLREELGTAPGPAAMAVHERMLRGGAPAVRPPTPARRARRRGRRRAPLAGAARRHPRAPRLRRPRPRKPPSCTAAGAARPRARVGSSCSPGEPGIGKTRLAAELAAPRARRRRARPLRPLRRGRPGALQAGGGAAARLGGRRVARARRRAGSGCAPPTSALVLPGAGARAARARGGGEPLRTGRGRRPPAARSSTRWRRCSPRSRAARRCWCCSTTSSGPISRPSASSAISCARPRPSARCSWPRMREAEAGEPLARLIAALRRDGTLQQLTLGGLDADETGALVAALGGRPEDAGFVAALHDETEGNPFFIEEVVRHLADDEGRLRCASAPSEAGVPAGVREITGRRLARLTQPARDALAAAAVIGREFDYDVLETAGPVAGDELVDALEEAVADGVLREDAERVGRYAFAHALVRATLYDSLSALRRARLHGKVGEALIARRGAQLDAQLGLLAHHFGLAAPAGAPERAVDFALAAGRRADRLLAWEEAADHYSAALRARELAGAPQDRLRCELLLALGTSQERAGSPDARATFAAAAATARALADPALLGRAALGFAGRWSQLGRVSEEVAGLLQEALAGLGERGLAAAGAAAGAAGARALLRLRHQPAARALRGGGDARPRARRSADAGHVPGRAPLRAVAAGDRARAARGGGGAAPDRGRARRPGARARGCGLDRGGPARARRRRGRRRAHRGRRAAGRGAAPAALPVVDVGLPLHAGPARRGLRARRAARAGDAGDRPARRGRERHARVRAVDVQHPPRAGPAGRGRGGGARLHRALPGRAGLALRARAAAARVRARGRGARAGRRRSAASPTCRATPTG